MFPKSDEYLAQQFNFWRSYCMVVFSITNSAKILIVTWQDLRNE